MKTVAVAFIWYYTNEALSAARDGVIPLDICLQSLPQIHHVSFLAVDLLFSDDAINQALEVSGTVQAPAV
jgi:hypothetical protein